MVGWASRMWGLESRLVKMKKVFVHAMKAYGGSRDSAPPVYNLGTRWRRVVNPTPRMRYPCIH